ncbi:DUF4270 domain-containing protein [Meridianimaribacter sp. CL38]|uniref:DUF4270 domain-containing protein n=1 Tax=Meridianimaribacter sp. CL38 TaxID=2213021 RepID=UPI00103EC5CD|nr:DUF4270 domain-containing protein [Meridianimaribacter sp. CL38]TBV28123.1 DUF4270 domain-containing protein [Meridianimaribacter sp. CL38]
MKKIKFALKYIAILTVLISSFIACDKDFASIDSDIINGDNATHFNSSQIQYDVIAYNKKLPPVQTNNLPVNPFGVYNDPVYGRTTASFVTQLNISTLDPDFGENIELDSVVLTIPYFSTATEVNSDGSTSYKLDSLYSNNYIDLSIYESNYFLRDFDPTSEFDITQRYYSNASTSSSDLINPVEFEGQLLYFEENFQPSPDQIVLKEENEDGEMEISDRLQPALRIKLDNAYWQEKILDKEGEPELTNQNNFSDYFRGLYFKAEAVGGDGNFLLLNLASSNANITLHYTKDPISDDGDRIASTYTIDFSGNRFNILENEYTIPLDDGDAVNGDEKLYLKGGEGSMAIINLFNGDENGDSPELEEFKSNNWLINEANLVFYVDQDMMIGDNETEPDRVYLYDLKNQTPLIDYYYDLTNTTYPLLSKANHLGALQREDTGSDDLGKGIKYKIRITEHINNILLNDSTNVKLGLTVSSNVDFENNTVQYSFQTDDEDFNRIPGSSIICPEGTVLFGNNTTNEEKKVYLEIFYTEPNN